MGRLPPASCWTWPAAVLALSIMSVSTASTGPQTIPLQGGLLHASGFIVESHVGGQAFHLQVDVSQGALTIPEVGCSTCRLGDRRYDYMKSTSNGHAVPCDNMLCDRNTCVAGAPGACPVCASGGRCCVPAPGSSEPTGLFSAAAAKDAACVFNLKFSDGMAGNGTMYEDSVVLGGATLPKVLFGAMREETGSFEVAYADGILGLGFQKSGRHPSRTPALMSYFANATGLPSVFTMCVSRFGGSLVLGAADKALTKGGADFKYVPLLNVMESDKYVVKVQGRGMVGDVEVQLPELASGVWSSATRSIAVGKTTFLAILETLMEHHCDIPGLCSVNSWFRQQSCHALEDSDFKKMPTLTFYIGDDLPIVLQPEDYLLAYKEVQGKLYRCVAFIVTDLLQERGYGILLGALIMQRYAVVYDMKEERIGVAEADMSKCGPPNGTTAGLSASSLGFQAPEHKNILTADAPAASLIGEAGSTLSVEFEQSETCRAIPGCSTCARNSNCSYSYNDGKCVSLAKAGSKPYPYCSGASCFCVAVGETGWYVGLAVGVVLALVTSAACFCAYHRRRRKLRYQAIVPFESSENEVEVFG